MNVFHVFGPTKNINWILEPYPVFLLDIVMKIIATSVFIPPLAASMFLDMWSLMKEHFHLLHLSLLQCHSRPILYSPPSFCTAVLPIHHLLQFNRLLLAHPHAAASPPVRHPIATPHPATSTKPAIVPPRSLGQRMGSLNSRFLSLPSILYLRPLWVMKNQPAMPNTTKIPIGE